MMHYVEDDSDLPALVQEFRYAPTSTFGEPIVPEIPVASEVTNPQASVEVSGIISHSPVGRDNLSQQTQEITPPPPLSKASGLSQDLAEGSGKSPPRLVRKGDLPHLSSVFEVIRASIPNSEQRAKTTAATSSTSTPASEDLSILPSKVVPAVTTESVRDMPPASSTTSLPYLSWLQ
ncbi:hypothetical protein ACFX1S_009436 [Malus domestica]